MGDGHYLDDAPQTQRRKFFLLGAYNTFVYKLISHTSVDRQPMFVATSRVLKLDFRHCELQIGGGLQLLRVAHLKAVEHRTLLPLDLRSRTPHAQAHSQQHHHDDRRNDDHIGAEREGVLLGRGGWRHVFVHSGLRGEHVAVLHANGVREGLQQIAQRARHASAIPCARGMRHGDAIGAVVGTRGESNRRNVVRGCVAWINNRFDNLRRRGEEGVIYS